MRVVLAEGLAPLRSALIRLLTAYGFEVVAAVGTAPDLRAALAEHQPSVAVVNAHLPPSGDDEGLRAAVTARRELPGLPLVLLSQHPEPRYAGELLADGAGAIGCLLRSRVFNDDQFVEAVRRVAAGGTAIDPQVVVGMLAEVASDERLRSLTRREGEVLMLLAEGRSAAAIAQRLFLSASAVTQQIANIFAKLGLPPLNDDNKRVLALLAYLDGGRNGA
ncbi:response regulator transcription factor [Amycolatopsis anabasis]|uniref:response regulator transcription factor n=1 Tax=Amycolatopsis anabasis TaxID=1840409 RepID=UPI00131D9FCB|nr:response regulator transcription factor [Amycolatopsis anabasis]